MKYFSNLFKVFLVTLFVIISSDTMGQTSSDSLAQQADSIEISLLTCTPGQQIWSLYGHTAIRFTDKVHNEDWAVNYGMFDFNQKNFILKFVFGRTDYQMGIVPFNIFLMEYASEGRGVIEQRLNLSREEKMAIAQAIAINYEPQNRVYRYNYFYDNCTTRARDIIVEHLSGKVEYKVNPSVETSYREMIHQWNNEHLWARFGNDLLLGVQADGKTDFEQQQFLPDTLRKDFGEAEIVDVNNHKRPLVDSTFEVLKVNEANVKDSTSGIWDTFRPRIVFLLLFIITLAIAAVEYKRKKTFWLYDVVLLTLDGLAGLCLMAMVFSTHPTVRINFQILLLNPLSIIFVYSVGNSIVHGHYHKYWSILFVCVILSVIAMFFQTFAEGMGFLACTLMVRCLINRKLYTGKKK